MSLETGAPLDLVAESTEDGFRSKQLLYNLAVRTKHEGKVEEAEALFIESLNKDESYVPALVRSTPQSTNGAFLPLPIAHPSEPRIRVAVPCSDLRFLAIGRASGRGSD